MRRNIFTILMLFECISVLGQTTFNKTQTITLTGFEGDAPYPIVSGDIDNDGFIDIVLGTDLGGAIFWFKNDGLGNFTQQPTVTNSLARVIDIVLVDINGDSTLDIIASSFTDDKVVYYPNNLSNPGTFGSEITIASSIDGASHLEVVLLNGDSYLDVAVAAFNADKIVWFAGNGDGTFGAENLMINSIAKPGSFDLKDINTDGELDLVVANAININDEPGLNTSVIEVFFNSGLTFTKDTNSVANDKDYMFNALFEDIDSSNNVGITSDILATDIFGDLTYYNRDALGIYNESIIPTTIANPASVAFYNIDDSVDGLKDIILSSGANGLGNDLVWFKNNGAGVFSAESIIDASQSNTYKFTVADFDNDGDLDIATAAYGDDQISIFNNQKYVLSTEEFLVGKIKMYPNPVSNYLKIDLPNYIELGYSVYSIIGTKVFDGILNTNTSIDVTGLNSGMYYIQLSDSRTVYKFIKK